MNYTLKAIAGGALLFPLFFALGGCGALPGSAGSEGSGAGNFAAAVWNVQALFDGEETGTEYGDYLEAAGWTEEKYAARITAISQAVLRMAEDKEGAPVPDLIGLVELENGEALDRLAGGALSKYGYSWTAFAKNPGAALGLGVLSRFPILEAKTHSISVGKDPAPRPVLELRVEPEGKPLVFLLCHWKSKLGGDVATEIQRRASARVVFRRLRELGEAGTPAIVMGDLNENYDEFRRHSGEILTALLPDESDAADLAARRAGPAEFLVLTGEKPPLARFFPERAALYSPWGTEMEGGSFYYKGQWETIDHFLLSGGLFDGGGWEYADCRALGFAPFAGPGGSPDAYIPRNGRGLSDHLPLLLFLRNSGGD